MEFEMFHDPISAFHRKADYNHETEKSGRPNICVLDGTKRSHL